MMSENRDYTRSGLGTESNCVRIYRCTVVSLSTTSVDFYTLHPLMEVSRKIKEETRLPTDSFLNNSVLSRSRELLSSRQVRCQSVFKNSRCILPLLCFLELLS